MRDAAHFGPEIPLDTVRSFPTPEHIAFRHRTAGPLIRASAWLLDLAIRSAVLLLLFIPIALVGMEVGVGLWLIAWFLADWLFGAFAEWRWKGVTPGKHVCHIRVVAADGQPPTLAACLLRNVLRFADALPTPATGILAMVLSGNFQRLGDLAAGPAHSGGDLHRPGQVRGHGDQLGDGIAEVLDAFYGYSYAGF